jgi:hypothetical protein
MADIGTSVGLQGIYQGDSAQNSPAYKKPDTFKFGDMLVDEIDKQEKKKKEEQEAFDKQISPFISVDGSKYLPERVPLIQQQSQRLLQEALKAKGKQGGNVMFNADVNKEMTKLQELQNKYSKEALIANEFQKKMLTDQAFEYDDNIKDEVSKAIEGRGGLDDNKYISSEFIDKGRNYSKYRKPEDRAKFLAYYTPNANDEIVTRVMQDGVYKDKVIKGSQIYETPEGIAAQKEKFYNLARTSQNPYVKGWIRQAEEEINANDDLVFQENFKDLTPLEAQDFIAQRAADLMLQDAINTNKLKKVDRTTKIPTGSAFTQNFGGTGGVETADGVFIPKESPMPTEEDFGKAWEKKNKEYFNRWQKSYKELNKDKTYIPKAELDEKYKKEVSKPSKNDPSLTIEEWNKKQLEKELSNARQGLTAISFTPKGDKWFEATATDGKTRKIIPKTIYKNDKGELVKIEGYNVDESTDKIKIDLEEFEVDATNENNRNSFIGKYPTTVKSASLNVPTKVIVSGKQGVGTIQGKTSPKKEAAKVIKSDGSDIAKWSKANEYSVGNKTYFYDNSAGKWKTK